MPSAPFCTDCPDREACSQAYPCHIVKEVAERAAIDRLATPHTIAYLGPVRAAAAERALEQAEARINALMEDRDTYKAAWEQTEQELTLTRDTLRLRSDAVNTVGATNDTLRATLTKVRELCDALTTAARIERLGERADVGELIEAIQSDLRDALDDQEPNA